MLRAAYPASHEVELELVLPRVAGRARTMLAAATGDVLDLGGGTSRLLDGYRRDASVTVVGVDPLAWPAVAARVARSSRSVGTDPGTLADRPDHSADTVVSLFHLCSVPDLRATLVEARRVLRPGGRLLFVEHVPRPGSHLARAVAAPAWRAWSRGCDLTRDVVADIGAAGYTVIDIERFTVPTFTSPLRWCATGAAHESVFRGRP